MENFELEGGLKVYFIGLGGISMSALAMLLKKEGYQVGGSDLHYDREVLKRLSGCGISAKKGHDAKNIANSDIVVYNSAISEENPELLKARRAGKPVLSRIELLNSIAKGYKNVISIAGSHGKTTATAMCAHIFSRAGSPTAHIGGMDLKFGNLLAGDKEHFISEACEYKRNFLKIPTDIAVVLNIDKDHLECYDSYQNLINSFREFAITAKKSVVNGDDLNLLGIENSVSYGLGKENNYRAVRIKQRKGRYSFTLNVKGENQGEIDLNVLGKHNIYNALAAAAVAMECGIKFSDIKEGLYNFKGVMRRQERIGYINGCEVYADYAHHPAEIEASIRGFESLKKKVTVLFQPHTYSRTKLLMDDFTKVLKKQKRLLIYATYPARESFDREGSAIKLVEKVGDSARYFDDGMKLTEYLLANVGKKDLLLVLGAGDLYEIMRDILENLSSDQA